MKRHNIYSNTLMLSLRYPYKIYEILSSKFKYISRKRK